ncbi:MAG: HAMP domain-containing histidine kinase [Gemmatimonadetes bacterium]|nr:HAMP domain-containing histidine kinase [Gemmatimonadota bacterium]
MVDPHSSRDRRSRVTPVMLLLLATLGLAGVLTYQAVDAAASHRETAERALRDHATFAAWEYTRLARKELEWHFWNVLKPVVYYHAPADPTALPTAPQLAECRATLAECDCPTVKFFWAYFAVDLKTGKTVWSGEKPKTAVAAWIADTVRTHAQTSYGERWDLAALLGPSQEQPVVLYSLRRDLRGEARVASGVLLDPALLPEALRWPYEKAELLPSALTGHSTNDSVLALRVEHRGTNLVYSAGGWYPATIVGADTLGAMYAGLTATVALNPALAQRLVIGGLPRSRMPLLLGLLGLTAGLVAVTLRQLRKEYELARLRSDFVSGVSHELRTPLAQIRMFTETLALERVRSPEEARRALDIVVRESERLSHLVDNVLQFSRAERGTMRLAPEPARLDLLLKDVVDAFRPLAQARQVTVRFASEAGITATVDPAAVRQIVLNLLDNAVKYGPAGQTVQVTLALEKGGAAISVQDQGPGIPKDARDQVWKPYWRLPRERESAVGGSGIGLAVVKELVDGHGGSVSVGDGANKGARFTVRVPGTLRMDLPPSSAASAAPAAPAPS